MARTASFHTPHGQNVGTKHDDSDVELVGELPHDRPPPNCGPGHGGGALLSDNRTSSVPMAVVGRLMVTDSRVTPVPDGGALFSVSMVGATIAG